MDELLDKLLLDQLELSELADDEDRDRLEEIIDEFDCADDATDDGIEKGRLAAIEVDKDDLSEVADELIADDEPILITLEFAAEDVSGDSDEDISLEEKFIALALATPREEIAADAFSSPPEPPPHADNHIGAINSQTMPFITPSLIFK
jgi:hypothetical protein